MVKHILVINAGSSSIKFAFFEVSPYPRKLLYGAVEKIGWRDADFYVHNAAGQSGSSREVIADHNTALKFIIHWLAKNIGERKIELVGHRIVHGGSKYSEPKVISPSVLGYLKSLEPLDPEHIPTQTKLIDAIAELLPAAKQVACFDTAFHHDLPLEAKILPIPRKYQKFGVHRYGFHGLSCEYVMQEFRRSDRYVANGRVIIAHLGNGVSLTAVKAGKSVDTTMSLTPASGVMMSTRSGDLDPSLAYVLAQLDDVNADKFNKMVNFKSGLLGLSATTPDMQQLLKAEAKDPRAKEAVDVFCYQIKKGIGALTAVMGGLDGLVFTGGMGSQSPQIRERVCNGLEFLNIQLDKTSNGNNAAIISHHTAKVVVRVMRTDEEMIIANQSLSLVEGGKNEAKG